jgi:membrane protein YdbS with pleckstrin-like domain
LSEGFEKGTSTSYVDKNLMADEHVVYTARLHWVVYAPALVAAVAGLVWPIVVGLEALPFGLVLIFVAPLLALAAWIVVKTSRFVVTNKRVMVDIGLIRRRSLEVPLGHVEDVSVDQGLEGRVLGHGTVTITGTGGVPELFKQIQAPLTFRQHIQQQIAAAHVTASGSVTPTPLEAVFGARDGGKDRRSGDRRSGTDRRATSTTNAAPLRESS